MSQHKTIPLELYRPIVDAIDSEDRSTLLSLLLTSLCFRAEAERVLYRSVGFRHAQPQRLFFRTVIDCPRVARLVLKYHCSLASFTEASDPYWNLLPAALRSLVNLKELGYKTFDRQPMAHVLRGCTFQLISFSWGCHPDEIELSKFLAGQEALETLHIDRWREKCAGPPVSSLRKLTRLVGNYGAILAFLPGRNITQLMWEPKFGDPDPNIPAISLALYNIRELAFVGSFNRLPLSIIIDHLPNLQFLRLIEANNAYLPIIHRLPSLVGLVIPLLGTWHEHIPPERFLDYITGLYSQSTTLRFIDVTIGYGTRGGEYQRWHRNSREPVNVYKPFSLWGREE